MERQAEDKRTIHADVWPGMQNTKNVFYCIWSYFYAYMQFYGQLMLPRPDGKDDDNYKPPMAELCSIYSYMPTVFPR
jgi:hypothetical protein